MLSVQRYSRWMPVQSGCEANPLLDGLRIEPTPGPTTLVIFGASGDLTRRKLLPALYQLSRGQRLPARFNVIGVARSPMSDDEFRDSLHDSLKEFAGRREAERRLERARPIAHATSAARWTTRRCTSGSATVSRAASAADGVLFYLAIPPTVYGTVIERLGATGLMKPRTDAGWRRVIVEKPFGTDLSTRARAQRGSCTSTWTSRRSSASITTSARRPSRTCWCSGSRTACSSRSGTGATSITCRSPRPRPSASSGARATTKARARCATWSRTT